MTPYPSKRRAKATEYACILRAAKEFLWDGHGKLNSHRTTGICSAIGRYDRLHPGHHEACNELCDWIAKMLNGYVFYCWWLRDKYRCKPNRRREQRGRHRWLDEMIAYMDKESVR